MEKVDRLLGKIIFRITGSLCLVIAIACLYALCRHWVEWNSESSLVPFVLIVLVGIGSVIAIPYCYSRKRILSEALEAIEGGAEGRQRNDPR